MVNEYQPELGQAIFGQSPQAFECPEILDAALQYVRLELRRVLWNLRQSGDQDPFGNSGDYFDCSAFTVEAYSWGDEEQDFNFLDKQSGLRLSWYKYFGRGMSCDRDVSPDDASDLLARCLSALRSVESGEETYSVVRPA